MKNKNYMIYVKGFLGLLLFLILLSGNTDIAKANSKHLQESDVKVEKTGDISEVELNEIMSTLDDRQLSNGDSFMVDGYQIDVEITTQPTVNTDVLSKNSTVTNSLNSTKSSTQTSTYGATCNVYISYPVMNIYVAVITHTATITNYSSGLVHINSGSVNVSVLSPTWSGDAYCYTLNNTNGSYSSAYGYVRLDNSTLNAYVLYKASVSVTPGSAPNFTFSKL